MSSLCRVFLPHFLILLIVAIVFLLYRNSTLTFGAFVTVLHENYTNVFEIDTVMTAENQSIVCEVEPWNTVSTENISFPEVRAKWRAKRLGQWGNVYNASLRAVSAFVYKEDLVVTTAALNRYGKPAFCRYYDCNRKEIPGSAFATIMFPVSAAYCARRAGAQFVGLSDQETEEVADPVAVTFRALDKPVHDVAVCVGPIYGKESRWMEIVETTEHHILMGIHYFYFTVFNEMDSYTRRLLDEYEQLGTAEVSVIGSEYETMDWMFHMLQINDCFFRARYHSKWILNVDIDERLVMTRLPLHSYLQTIPDDVGEISFSTKRVQRTEGLPKEFTGIENLRKELLFLNYSHMTPMSYREIKGIVRPDKTDAMFYHWTFARYPGVRIMSAAKDVGYVRHYRTTLKSLAKNWFSDPSLHFRPNRFDRKFEDKLLAAIVRRVKKVYEKRPIWCEEVTPHLLQIFTKDNYICIWKQNGTRFDA